MNKVPNNLLHASTVGNGGEDMLVVRDNRGNIGTNTEVEFDEGILYCEGGNFYSDNRSDMYLLHSEKNMKGRCMLRNATLPITFQKKQRVS